MITLNSRDEWGTPFKLFNKLDSEFKFTLDPCGNPTRMLRDDLVTLGIIEDGPKQECYYISNGLDYSWKNEIIFCNPPYTGRGTISKWIKKGFDNRANSDCIVFLIPVRTDRKFYHNYVKDYAEVQFLDYRPDFVPLAGQGRVGVPAFPSMLIIYRRN